LETRLLAWLLSRFPEAKSVLEVGCGTGHFTRWLEHLGMHAVGLDASSAMLQEASSRNGGCYWQGDALNLPFGDGSFDLVALITTLEFLTDPGRALREAARVARMGLLLGVLNRQSLLALRRRGLSAPPWDSAHFFTVRQLRQLVRENLSSRRTGICWRTTLWPIPCVGSLPLPWGDFIGMAVHLD